jgi:hypothetical protein
VSFARKWMELEILMLSKIILTQKAKCHMFSLIRGSGPKMMTMVMEHEHQVGDCLGGSAGGGGERRQYWE